MPVEPLLGGGGDPLPGTVGASSEEEPITEHALEALAPVAAVLPISPVTEQPTSPLDEITTYLQSTLNVARESGDPEEVARVQRLVTEHRRLVAASAGPPVS